MSGVSTQQISESVNNVVENVVDSSKAVINNAMSNIDPFLSTNDPITTVGDESVIPDAASIMTNYEINKDNQWGWITLYVVTIVIAVLGNLLFIVSSLCTKRTRTTGYYLLINLSIRDILLAALCVPFTLDSEIIALNWNFGQIYCICYRFFYYCFLFFLPLTLIFLAWHLFVENCKWNFAGEEGVVPRPWPHTIYIPMIWFFSFLFAVPTVFWSDVRPLNDDFYRNEISYRNEPEKAEVCMHTKDGAFFWPQDWGITNDGWEAGSNFFFITSTLVTFCIPVLLLFLPWCALAVQICGCCTRKLRSSEFWLSLITLFLILFYETSRAPFELFNFHYILKNWGITSLSMDELLPGVIAESYKAVMKWAVYAPALLHPLLYFTFSPEARHGAYILFSRCCSCCCSKSAGMDVEVASDDEKGQMLQNEDQGAALDDSHNAPLHPTGDDNM